MAKSGGDQRAPAPDRSSHGRPPSGADHEDTSGAAGFVPAGGVEWFKAAGGAWHGGGSGDAGRSRGFQLWLALPPDQELGPSESIHQKPHDVHANGAAAL